MNIKFKINQNINGDIMATFFMCIKIFCARLIDVSLGTFRTINTVKGKGISFPYLLRLVMKRNRSYS